MDNKINEKILGEPADSSVMEATAAYAENIVNQPVSGKDQLLSLYNLTQEIKNEGGNPRMYKLWVQRAEDVLRHYPFETMDEYVSLTARAEILYNLKRYIEVINLIESESSPVTRIPDDNEISIFDYGSYGTETPRIVAIKSLSLGHLNRLDEAVQQMRKACELYKGWRCYSECFGEDIICNSINISSIAEY